MVLFGEWTPASNLSFVLEHDCSIRYDGARSG